ncbi:hypothetical protein DRE_00733 [Drechslerella stenobrocha 248]|uniref:Uncharacterized protein n=1 Tax=Drechslerella stenobrocha 248 TaxID=1043628 RepID=W7HQA0_9PEZI|nr:hypothetical protein DRE_00733 [Drechslerella stenobrocha 248]
MHRLLATSVKRRDPKDLLQLVGRNSITRSRLPSFQQSRSHNLQKWTAATNHAELESSQNRPPAHPIRKPRNHLACASQGGLSRALAQVRARCCAGAQNRYRTYSKSRAQRYAPPGSGGGPRPNARCYEGTGTPSPPNLSSLPSPPPPPPQRRTGYRQGAQQAYRTQENSEPSAWRIPYHETEVLISTVENTSASPGGYTSISRSPSNRRPENQVVDPSCWDFSSFESTLGSNRRVIENTVGSDHRVVENTFSSSHGVVENTFDSSRGAVENTHSSNQRTVENTLGSDHTAVENTYGSDYRAANNTPSFDHRATESTYNSDHRATENTYSSDYGAAENTYNSDYGAENTYSSDYRATENTYVSDYRTAENTYGADQRATESTLGSNQRAPSYNMAAREQHNTEAEGASDGYAEATRYLWGGPVSFYDTSKPNWTPPTAQTQEAVEQDRNNTGLRTIRPEADPSEEKIAMDFSDYFMPSYQPAQPSREHTPAPSRHSAYQHDSAPCPVVPHASISDPFPIAVEQERYHSELTSMRESQYPEVVDLGSDPLYQPSSRAYSSYRRTPRRATDNSTPGLDANGLPSLSGILGPSSRQPRQNFNYSDEKQLYQHGCNDSSVSVLSTHSDVGPPSGRHGSDLRHTPSYSSIRKNAGNARPQQQQQQPCEEKKPGLPPLPPGRYFSQRAGNGKLGRLMQERKMEAVVEEMNRRDDLHRRIQEESRRWGS